MQRVYNILRTLLGESKQGGYDNNTNQYQFNCPHCAEEKGGIDNKFNLEVSFTLGKFHCWSCNDMGPISKLIKTRGGKTFLTEYYSIINDIKETKYFNLDLFKDYEDINNNKNLLLPSTFKKIDIRTCRNKSLIKFLESRKITQDIIDKYNIGYTTWDEDDWSWRDRIVFPSYNAVGDLNYYVGRNFKDKDKRNKYKNCDVNKYEIILHEDKIQWDADIYLVEGAIDCIYGNNFISMLGKILNKNSYLFSQLYEKANANIIIVLDGDTSDKEIKRIYNTLNIGRLRDRIRYIKLGTNDLPWKDFGEAYECDGKKSIIECIKSQRFYDEIDLLI
jgi:DNA primase